MTADATYTLELRVIAAATDPDTLIANAAKALAAAGITTVGATCAAASSHHGRSHQQ